MARIVLATFGSLGDLHPKIALGLELKKRGHNVTIAAMEPYRERIDMLGLAFRPMAPDIDPNDTDLIRDLLHPFHGTERLIRDLIMPAVRQMYEDLIAAVAGADLVITGEAVYAASSVVEKTDISWISTSLAPISFFSPYDPPVPPQVPQFEKLRLFGHGFHRGVMRVAKWMVRDWYRPYGKFRRDLGLSEDHDPIFSGKFSPLLHLALFSKVLGRPQPDWPSDTVQTGFCFYDGHADTGNMPDGLPEFFESGEPPIVFTLGSAAVMDAGDFFEQSIQAAKGLRRRAIIIYGVYSIPPAGLTKNIVGFDYAPYSLVFPRAACVVHQGGVGTTGQVLRAGVPHLIVPYAHDQPDNAARCRRLGVAEIMRRNDYSAGAAARMLEKILSDPGYLASARGAAKIIATEGGAEAACDEIEKALDAEAPAIVRS